MATPTSLPYDIKSPKSIFEYSKLLLGRRLRDFVTENYEVKKGKGSLGQMVENIFFLLETNSYPGADFSEAGMELKCTPLLKGKHDQLHIKERLVCNMINYNDVVNEDFEHSHFYLKCQLMLLLFYLHLKDCDNLDLEFLFSKAHELSEGDTMYLGACRKGAKGDKLVSQPNNAEVLAPRRAFSLKMAYMRTVLSYVVESGKNAVSNVEGVESELVSVKALRKQSFDDILLDRFRPYMHMDYKSIAKKLKVNISKAPKNLFAIIANAIAASRGCYNINQSEEFLKAGLTMKTIRVNANGNIREAMSFENIDYMEIAECENWYDSRLYELYSSRFMFVIFKEQNQGKKDFVLDDVFFWTMPQIDLEGAEEYWNHIRECVLNDHISEAYWWKASDKKKFHVRPKADKAEHLTPTPNGTMAKKYCYWFNNDYVRDIVRNHKNNI